MSLSVFLANAVHSFVRRWGRGTLRKMTAALPAHGETIAVAQIDVGHVRGALTHELRGHQHEALEARIDLLPAQAHLHAVVEREIPGTTRIEIERGEAQADFG